MRRLFWIGLAVVVVGVTGDLIYHGIVEREEIFPLDDLSELVSHAFILLGIGVIVACVGILGVRGLVAVLRKG